MKPTPSSPISVVVPTRDRPDELRRCLGALRAQTEPVEIVVVDDRPPAAATGSLPGIGGGAVRVLAGGGRGPAAARNAGARVARASGAEIVLFTDDDCAPAPEWAARLAAAAAETGAAAGRTVAPAGADAPTRASQAIIDQLQIDSLDPLRGTLEFAPTCNLACSAELLARLPFDESFRLAGGEDRDWSARALATGQAIRFEPAAVVVHNQPPGLRPFVARQVRYGRGSVQHRSTGAGGRARAGYHRRLLVRGAALGPAVVALLVVGQLVTAAAVVAERLTGLSARRGALSG